MKGKQNVFLVERMRVSSHFLVENALSIKKYLPYSIVQENQPNFMNRYKDLKNLRIGSFFIYEKYLVPKISYLI